MIIDIPPMYEQYIQQLAQEQNLTVSEYVVSLLPVQEMDSTEFLLSSPKNAERLLNSIANARAGHVVHHGLIET